MAFRSTTSHPLKWPVGLAASAVLALSLLAANSIGTYQIAGSVLTGVKGFPQPIGWIVRLLVIESWVTQKTIEIRWVAWALGVLGLVALAVGVRRRQPAAQPVAPVFGMLVISSTLLAVLVAIRAIFSQVPEMGLVWTWQLLLALIWMLVLYVWTIGLSLQTLTRALALSLSTLSAIGLLYCIQARQPYPNWPTGNVLLLTTACLAAVFLLGPRAYGRLAAARRTGDLRDYAVGLAVATLFVINAVALSLSGRRAGVLGLTAGAGFIAILTFLRRAEARVAGAATSQSPDTASPGERSAALTASDPARRAKLVILAVVLVLLVGGLVVAPRLLTAGRWQTVLFRVETYKNAAYLLLDRPSAPLVGVGPGHLGFHLTSMMRPLHSESPRLFHGGLAEYAHSEPLQAIVELGLPLGLLYLALLFGGLVGFAVAYRRTLDEPGRLTILGAGAALAAVLAAEATSVGMRHPGVAALAWALAGLGWACGAQAGAFERLTRRLPLPADLATRVAGSRWLAVAGLVCGLLLLLLSFQAVRAGYYLYQGQDAWSRARFADADRLLGKAFLPATGGEWMARKYLQGRANVAQMAQAQNAEEQAVFQDRALDALSTVVSACIAYRDAAVWLGKAGGDWDNTRAICENFVRYDPYDREARLVQASMPGVTPTEQMQFLRLAIRNVSITGHIAHMISQAAQEPASQQLLTQWMAHAEQALQQPDPAAWSDPLSLESLRIAVVLAGHQGKPADAYGLANKAATLCRYLSADPYRHRLETVEMEVYLDQTWFGWLLRPDAARANLAVLESHLRDLVRGPTESFSEKMAAQFAAMLWLSQGPDADNGKKAMLALYMSNPSADGPVLRRMTALAYARLVALVGPRVPPAQAEAWTREGRRLLGENLWNQVVHAAAAQGPAPWWFGILSED